MDLALNSALSLPSLGGVDYSALQADAALRKEKALSGETQNLFASQLAQVDAAAAQAPVAETRQSMSLTPKQAAQGLPAMKEETETADEVDAEDEEAPAPEIARSWRLEGAEKETEVQEEATLSWDDFLDFINPLQHIPVLGTIYRQVTGDEIKPSVQIAGNIMYGAVTGSLALSTVSGIASAVFEEHTGQEPTIQIAQAILGDDVVGGPSESAGTVDANRVSETIQLAAATESAKQENAKIVTNLSQAADVAEAAPAAQAAQAVPATIGAASGAKKVASKARIAPSATKMPAEAALLMAQAADKSSSARRTRIGNKLMVRPAQSVTTQTASDQAKAASVEAPQEKAAENQTASSASADNSKLKNVDGATLSSMMRAQGDAKAAGQSLPPNLVQDMMLMALDKYKTAHALSGEAEEALVQ